PAREHERAMATEVGGSVRTIEPNMRTRFMGKTGITKEFKEFIARGNVLDMAVGIVVGTSFGAIAQSLASDVLMPPIRVILGNVDFSNLFLLLKAGHPAPPYATLADAQPPGAVTLN